MDRYGDFTTEGARTTVKSGVGSQEPPMSKNECANPVGPGGVVASVVSGVLSYPNSVGNVAKGGAENNG